MIDTEPILKDANKTPILDLLEAFLDAPIIEPKQGEWVKETKHYKDAEQEFFYYAIRCSECGNKPEKPGHLTPFCPMCGAEMRERAE